MMMPPSNENFHTYETHNKKLPKISKHTNAQNNGSFLVKSTMSYSDQKHNQEKKECLYNYKSIKK